MEEYQNDWSFPAKWLGAWESVSGNPDMYIFQGYDGNYYLLAYNYDRESERGSFSCYDINFDEEGFYVRIGMKPCRIKSETSPFGLYIAGWGSYMKY